jgi:hypothetical protein
MVGIKNFLFCWNEENQTFFETSSLEAGNGTFFFLPTNLFFL